jgi:hypothetical protein
MNRTIKLNATKRIALMGAAAFLLGAAAQVQAFAQLPMPIILNPAVKIARPPAPKPPAPKPPAPKK